MIQSKKAFTLIEVVLAVAILASLSITIASSISQALKAKKKIQTEVTDVSGLRDTMKVIRADIHQAYNHVDFEKEISDSVAKPNTPANSPSNTNVVAGPNANTPPPKPRENKREDPRTDFFGSESKLNFVTMNNGRMIYKLILSKSATN
jgi:prepilin-type N-terminal cleavage/methylation domain-containing protein